MNKFVPIAAASALLVGITGCGSSNNDSTTAASTATTATSTASTATTPATSASHTLDIVMSDYKFAPMNATAASGSVTISAKNVGKVPHELVILKTSADPANLPKKNGEVDESSSVGEIPDVSPGKTKKVTLKLAPGKYAMVCNLPGHYAAGMYGSLTVG